uniref:Uncharacterized protein n=1 Tax=viral metagenome TaxID=1070528 RepID=A0A6C0E3T2_9ZZZZ
MSQSFIPGARPRFTKVYTYVIFKNYNTCNCIQQKVNSVKTGWNNPTQTENMRISQILSNNLGGKVTWGNYGISAKVNYLGRVEGQAGGSLKPLRNQF